MTHDVKKEKEMLMRVPCFVILFGFAGSAFSVVYSYF